jgi:hypothetical protein
MYPAVPFGEARLRIFMHQKIWINLNKYTIAGEHSFETVQCVYSPSTDTTLMWTREVQYKGDCLCLIVPVIGGRWR